MSFIVKFSFPFSVHGLHWVKLPLYVIYILHQFLHCISIWPPPKHILNPTEKTHGLSADQHLAELAPWGALRLPHSAFLWVWLENCGGHWDTAPRGAAWAGGLQLSARPRTAWATGDISPQAAPSPGAHTQRLVVDESGWSVHLAPWGQLWKPLQFPNCLWGRPRP